MMRGTRVERTARVGKLMDVTTEFIASNAYCFGNQPSTVFYGNDPESGHQIQGTQSRQLSSLTMTRSGMFFQQTLAGGLHWRALFHRLWQRKEQVVMKVAE